jgi:acyl-CoA synthetase (AMP-forming)/AMP-acid ligase II
VIGVADNILGSAVKAFVVPEGETFDADTLVGFCGDRMPDYMVPKMIEFVSEIPKTSNGKADYAELRRRERR